MENSVITACMLDETGYQQYRMAVEILRRTLARSIDRETWKFIDIDNPVIEFEGVRFIRDVSRGTKATK